MENQISSISNQTKAYVILTLACLLAYANSLGGDFVFDDTMQVVGNPSIRSWSNIVNAFTTDVWAFRQNTGHQDIPPPYYRPFFTIYLTIGYQLFGLWQQGWHLFNLGIHILATILVYLFLLRVSENNDRLSLVGALLFALIPVHVESISWISGNPDALAALFLIPSVLCYFNWQKSNKLKDLVISLVLFLCSLFCKETPIVMPFILFCWAIIKNKGDKDIVEKVIGSVKSVLVFIIPIIVYLGLRISVLGKVSWRHPMTTDNSTELIYATIPSVFLTYLKNIIFPFDLSLIYNTRFVSSFSDLLLWVPVVILAGLIVLIYLSRKLLTTQMWMALILFIVPLLPVLNLQVFHYEYIVQDRYLYIPSIGFVWFVACLIEELWNSEKGIFKKLAPVLVAVLCISYLIGTIWQNRMWNSAVSLWSRAIVVKPNNWAAHYNLGLAYYLEKNYEAAQREFDTALTFTSFARRDDLIYVNRGLAKKELNNKDEAKKDFLKALEVNPKSFEAITNLGILAYEQQNYVEAEKQLRQAAQINPLSQAVEFNLARTLSKLQRDKEAVTFYEKLLKKQDSDAELFYNAAISYAKLGQNDLARKLLINADETTKDQSLKQQIRDEFEKIK